MGHVLTDNSTVISTPDLEKLFCFNGPVWIYWHETEQKIACFNKIQPV